MTSGKANRFATRRDRWARPIRSQGKPLGYNEPETPEHAVPGAPATPNGGMPGSRSARNLFRWLPAGEEEAEPEPNPPTGGGGAGAEGERGAREYESVRFDTARGVDKENVLDRDARGETDDDRDAPSEFGQDASLDGVSPGSKPDLFGRDRN